MVTRILLIGIIMVSFVFAQEIILKENQVILKTEWAPVEEQTDRALTTIVEYLNNIGENTDQVYLINSAKKILAEINQYCVQFTGINKDGKKIIHCNFFHIEDHWKHGSPGHPNWKESLVMVLDGGYWYWQIEYDIETKKCFNFRVNGEA
jgi:hypothetical protein